MNEQLKLVGKLMRLPAIEHRQHTMMGVAKHWMAERVATEVTFIIPSLP